MAGLIQLGPCLLPRSPTCSHVLKCSHGSLSLLVQLHHRHMSLPSRTPAKKGPLNLQHQHLRIAPAIPASTMTSSVPPTAEPSPRAARSGGAKRTYLLTYNFVSTILWAAVLGRVVLTVLFAGWGNVYRSTGGFAFWTQLGAVAEVGHAALGGWL